MFTTLERLMSWKCLGGLNGKLSWGDRTPRVSGRVFSGSCFWRQLRWGEGGAVAVVPVIGTKKVAPRGLHKEARSPCPTHDVRGNPWHITRHASRSHRTASQGPAKEPTVYASQAPQVPPYRWVRFGPPGVCSGPPMSTHSAAA